MWRNIRIAFHQGFRRRVVHNQYYLKNYLLYFEVEIQQRLEVAINNQNNNN